jgi:hypothetical protein
MLDSCKRCNLNIVMFSGNWEERCKASFSVMEATKTRSIYFTDIWLSFMWMTTHSQVLVHIVDPKFLETKT